MEEIKYDGISYYVYIKKENPNPNHQYETIVKADTGEMVDNEIELVRKFLIANNEFEDKGKNTRSNIKKLHSVLQRPGAIKELPNNLEFRSPIDFISILEYIEKYGNKPYKALEKCNTDEERKEISDISEHATKSRNEFTKIAKVIESNYSLYSWDPSSWTDNSHIRIRDYLWIQMRYTDYNNYRSSISIVAQKSVQDTQKREKPRFRFSLGFKEDGATADDYEKFHKFLDIPLKKGLSYVVTSNQLNEVVVDEDNNTVKKKLKDGIYKKVHLSKVIEYDPSLTNEIIHNEMISGVKDLLPYYNYVIGKDDNVELEVKSVNNKIGLNTILYGPPGTGKTYNTKKYVVAICDYNGDLSKVEKFDYDTVITPRYNELLSEGRVKFTTFHQSYGYEEFIEGIKPSLDEDNVIYDIVSGVFKQFCENAKTSLTNVDSIGVDPNAPIWKMALYGGKTNVLKECFDEGYIRIGFDINSSDHSLNIFKNKMQIGDIVLSLYSFYEINGIGIIEGNVEELVNKVEYKVARKVRWLFKDKIINIKEINGGNRLPIKTCSNLPNISRTGVMELIKENTNIDIKTSIKPYVFIIDEINRGNISKIFGELITLIEESKRGGAKEEMSVTLPYSGQSFSVPNNVYILGTMNTADRSISLMDTALRRRFNFIEMMPDSSIVKDVTVAGVNIKEMLETINKRITVLYDREHTIGHAFFTGLDNNSTIDDLASIFKNKVIPLLQEYFYEDYSKIRLVLGDNGKQDDRYQFIHEIDNSKDKTIFKGNYDLDITSNYRYEINNEALKEAESYIQIYK